MDGDALSRIAALLERATATGDISQRLPREVVAERPELASVVTALHSLLDKLWVQEFQVAAKHEMVEKVLELRTREIHEILENISSGFLVARPDQTVLPNYTRSCTRIFGAVTLEGERLSTLMGLDEREREAFSDAYEQIFADVEPVEARVAKLPPDFSLNGRSYRIEVAPLVSRLGEVTKVFVTIIDTTELRKVEAESALRLTLLEILRRRDGFRNALAQVRRAVAAARVTPRQGTLRGVFQTVARHLGPFNLFEVEILVRSLDECHELVLRDLDTLEGTLRGFLARHRELLRIDDDALLEVRPATPLDRAATPAPTTTGTGS